MRSYDPAHGQVNGEPHSVGYNEYGPTHNGYGYYTAEIDSLPPSRTVLIGGFPKDIQDRELNNLLLFLPGYQASVLSWDEHEVRGHALFSTHALAKEAMQRIDGKVEFDAGCTLLAELAREDLGLDDPAQPKRSRPLEEYAPARLSAPSGHAASPAAQAPPPVPMPTYISAAPAGMMPYGAGPYGYAPAAVAVAPAPALATPPRSYAPVKNDKDNPPCNTLFIGNLGEGVDENELRANFGLLPGFQQVKVVHGARGVSAFIEFADVSTAAACHATQQGLLLASSDRGPIRVQYSKNPFGRKRDSQGNAAALAPMPYPAYAMQPAMPAYAQGLVYSAG